MASSASRALEKRSSDTELMPPPPQPKRIKRPTKVLDEDTYTDALSHIIARDFFPGLLETDAQQNYLDALDSQDPEWIATAGDQLKEMMTPGPEGRRLRGRRGTSMASGLGEITPLAGATPQGWRGDTPGSSTSRTTSSKREGKAVDVNMSLGAFQSKYTSEDNESFYKLLDKQNERKAEKYAWVNDNNKIPSARLIAYRKREAQKEEDQRKRAIEDGGKATISDQTDKRKAMPDSWKARPDNQLMFAPDSIEDTYQTVQQRAEEKSRAPPKAISYDNTRMPAPELAEPAEPGSPTLSAVRDAIAGRPRLSDSEAGSAVGGSETPRVNGYAFVDSEEPEPVRRSKKDSFTPLSLGPGDATPNPFSIKDKSSREALHHRMVDRISKSKRKEVDTGAEQGKTPIPKFTSGPRTAKGGLTPAGQKLFGSMGTKTPSGSVWEGGKTPKAKAQGEDWRSKIKTPRQ